MSSPYRTVSLRQDGTVGVKRIAYGGTFELAEPADESDPDDLSDTADAPVVETDVLEAPGPAR